MTGPDAPTFARPLPPEYLDFSHRTAFLTGASRGLGEAIANRLAELGCTV